MPRIHADEIKGGLSRPELDLLNQWLERGDGVAVYENVEFGHPEQGHRKYVSFGSDRAQLPSETPPTRMPDIGDTINWRYQLAGVYRGEAL